MHQKLTRTLRAALAASPLLAGLAPAQTTCNPVPSTLPALCSNASSSGGLYTTSDASIVSSGGAAAQSDLGVNRAKAVGSAGSMLGASRYWFDEIAISAAPTAPYTLAFDWSLAGALTASGFPNLARALFDFKLGPDEGNFGIFYLPGVSLSFYTPMPTSPPPDVVVVNGPVRESGTLYFSGLGDSLLALQAQLSVETMESAQATFFSTAKLDAVRIVSGAPTLTSASGTLLWDGSQYVYAAAVPELSSALQLLVGGIWVAGLVRRRVARPLPGGANGAFVQTRT
jgi:hypothetical protein